MSVTVRAIDTRASVSSEKKVKRYCDVGAPDAE